MSVYLRWLLWGIYEESINDKTRIISDKNSRKYSFTSSALDLIGTLDLNSSIFMWPIIYLYKNLEDRKEVCKSRRTDSVFSIKERS